MCKCTKDNESFIPQRTIVDIVRVQNMCKCGKRTYPPGPKAALTQIKMHAWEKPSGAKVNPTCKRAHVRPPGPSTQTRRTPGVYNADEKQLKTSKKKLEPTNANSTTQRMRTPGANYNSDNSSAYSRRVQQQRSQCTLEAQSVEKAAR